MHYSPSQNHSIKYVLFFLHFSVAEWAHKAGKIRDPWALAAQKFIWAQPLSFTHLSWAYLDNSSITLTRNIQFLPTIYRWKANKIIYNFYVEHKTNSAIYLLKIEAEFRPDELFLGLLRSVLQKKS